MDALRRRIEDILLPSLADAHTLWYLKGAIDRILVEVENEFAYRKAKEATTDEGAAQRELPL